MDAELETLIQPVVQMLEDTWGVPLTDHEKLCVLNGVVFGEHRQLEQFTQPLKSFAHPLAEKRTPGLR